MCLSSVGLTAGRQLLRSTCTSNFPAVISSQAPALISAVDDKEVVNKLLALVAETDSGASAEEGQKLEIEGLVTHLEDNCVDEPLKSPLIFGEWDVVYTSSPTAAGGYYRSLLGRILLNTTELVQTISEPNFAGNRVVFRAFNIIPGRVLLKGKFEALDEKWVKVEFESPTFELGSISFQYGGISSVQLSVTYLDDRVRIGRGSRGSLFVFKRR